MTRGSLLAALGVLLALGRPAAGAPTWGTPVQLSTGDRALGPELAISPEGDAAVVWDQEVGSDCASSPASLACAHIVELTTRKRGTSAWQAPVELGRPGIGDRPHVAINDAGDAVVAWVHDIGRDRVLQATFRSRSQNAWPEPSDVSEPSLEVRDFQIGIDTRGDVVAAWAERTDAGVAVRVAKRLAASGGWGAAKTLSTPGSIVSGSPSLTLAPEGILEVAWIEDGSVREAWDDVHFDFFPVRGLSDGSGAPIGTPDIALGRLGWDAVVAWSSRTASGDCCEMRTAFYSGIRGDWEHQQPVGDLRDSLARPRVGFDAKRNALAVWASPHGIESAARTFDTSTWSSPTLVSARSPTAGDPVLGLDSAGNAVAVWTTGTGVVQAALRPVASGEWQPPVELSTPGSSIPRATLDASGNAFSVWNLAAPTRVVVQGAVLAGTGPILSHLQSPRHAMVTGALARFAVRAVPWAAPLNGVPAWRFGDGATAIGAAVAHAYVRAGRYSVSVSQADQAGGVSTSTVTVDVIGRARNLRRPSITGSPRVGQTLTCRRGVWAGARPIRYAYRWISDGRSIPRATRTRYRLTGRDLGSLVACEVKATNAAGSAHVSSAAVRVVR